jgi:serine/threonine protein kinase
VLVNVALRLADLHEAGWVHRDLKPGNVLWLPRKQRWTLIDFALATHEGVETPVIFTPSYAAPEIVQVSSCPNPL